MTTINESVDATSVRQAHRDTIRKAYSTLLSVVGIGLILAGVVQAVFTDSPLTLILLIGLGVISQITMTAFVEGNAGVSVSSAVSLTAAYLYGPLAGALVAAMAEVGLWIMHTYSKRHEDQDWQRSFELLGVNVGMNAIAALAAGISLRWLMNLWGTATIIGQVVPWLISAIIGDQVNMWLLVYIIHLAHGVKPLQVWRENRWAIPINVLVMSVGGGLLSLAVQQFDLLGIAIFFLPIVLSSYSFRLTVNNTKKQMAKLEEMVASRTVDLAEANEQLGKSYQQLEKINYQLEDTNKQLEATNSELAVAYEEVESLSRDKDAFLAVLTHDMRTPLTSIKGYSSILRDRELEREQQIKIAKVIMHSQDTLLDIVNNILEIEKLQSGVPILLEYAQVDLALITQRVVETIAAPAREKRIQLKYEQVPTPIMVTADESKIERVITNLASNAVKYTPEEGCVTIDVRTNGRFAVFSVQDNGYGIPSDELPHIFDRYSRVKGHQHLAVGTGLGLAIVKSLVEAHEGEIFVTSEENVGSTFTVKLPLL
ncbi:MAG: HAMP domain-containing histidine kinase [Anaerolineales bacterium]|nr:HAMP domain-containing histidine kinase [Anaerolineales bacterium]